MKAAGAAAEAEAPAARTNKQETQICSNAATKFRSTDCRQVMKAADAAAEAEAAAARIKDLEAQLAAGSRADSAAAAAAVDKQVW